MATIEIEFTFENAECSEEQILTEEFELDSCVEDAIATFIREAPEENDFEGEADDWDCTSEEVIDVCIESDAKTDEGSFSSLDELGEYAELAEKLGEAFIMRYEDIGSLTRSEFEETYRGHWRNEVEFAQDDYDSSYGSDNPLYGYVDWDYYARDFMMDFSTYENSDGAHIFSDC
jgi:antirestriction protein